VGNKNRRHRTARSGRLPDIGGIVFDQLKFALSAGRVAPLGLEAFVSSALRAARPRRSELETPCAPIVLMHGFAGFRELGVGSFTLLEYFNGVRRLLGQMGYRVFAPEVAPFNHPLERARQWMSHIEAIRQQTGAEKVHLVGHSQGGLDARVLVAPACPAADTPIGPLLGLGYGPHVASVTTLATPHLGSPLADEVEQEVPAHQDAVDALLRLVSLVAQLVKGDPQDARRAVRVLSRRFMLEHFNRIIQDDPSVPCYAIAGDPACPSVVNPLLRPTYLALNQIDPSLGGGPNDALVTVESSFFGNVPESYAGQESAQLAAHQRAHWQVLGVVQADHIAEVGIPLRLLPSDAYDHLALFAGLAHSLDPAYIAEMSLQKDGRWLRKPKARSARVE
jgi:pimeloyl-ACP methyl ester carboxylesterase